jgi:hypothetical protein
MTITSGSKAFLRVGDFIYESPDGGKTVYAREHGSSDRILVSGRDYIAETRRIVKRRKLLEKICELAETNPTINDQLLKLEELYILISDDKDD